MQVRESWRGGEVILGYLCGPIVIRKSLQGWGRGAVMEAEGCGGGREREIEMEAWRHHPAGFEDGRRDHKPIAWDWKR